MDRPDTAASDFLTASELGPLTADAFGRRLAAFDATEPAVHPWQRTGPATPLSRPSSPLQRLLARRRSLRTFGPEPLGVRDIAAIFAAVAQHGDGRRGHPSGGGLYAVGAAGILWRTRHPLNGQVVWHDPVRHALTALGAAPDWAAERQALGGLDTDTPPAAAVLLFGDPDRTAAKYGDRGVRFMLLEAGAAAQSIGLTLAERRLAGYLTGGAFDERMRALAGLSGTSARCLATFLVGRRAR